MSKIRNNQSTPVQSPSVKEKQEKPKAAEEGLSFNRIVKTLNGAMSYIGLTRQNSQTDESSPRALVSYSVDKPERVGVGVMTEAQVNGSLLSCEWDIQQLAQKLARSTRDNPQVCRQLAESLEQFELLLGQTSNPIVAGQKLHHIKTRLEDQLELTPAQLSGFLRSSANPNYVALQQMIAKQEQRVESLLLKPQHDFGSLTIPFEVEQAVRTVSEKFHQQDIAEMRARFDKDGTLVAPTQTRKDLQRQDFHCHSSEGDSFDNASLRRLYGEVEESEQPQILQQIEDGLLDFLKGVPVEQQMEVLSHVSQSEQNHMHYCLQGLLSEQLPMLGSLSQSEGVEREIAVERDGENIEITYKMAFSPRFATELGMVDYPDPSKIEMERRVVIAPGTEPAYLPMHVHMHLHQGARLQ